MAEKLIDGSRQIQDKSIIKEKLNLIDPVLPYDPVTLHYLENTGFENGLQKVNERIDQGLLLLDELRERSYPSLEPTWININSFAVATNGAGATVSNTNKTISILSGSTGAGASLKQFLDLSSFPLYEVGDEIILRLLLIESVVNSINPNVIELKMNVDGVPYSAYYTAKRYTNNDQIIEIKVPYTITNKNAVIDFTFGIKSSAPAQPTNLLLTWNFFGVFNNKDKYHDTILAVSETLKQVQELYSFSERRPIVSKVNTTNTSDNTQRLQDEVDEATQTSGELILPRNSTILLKDTVNLNGGVRIIGGGNTYFNGEWTTANKEIFSIVTNDRIELDNFGFVRTVGQWQPSAIKFSSNNLNIDSVFRRILFSNLPNSLYIDYTEGLLIDDCRFNSGQNSILLGSIGLNSNKNVTLRNNKFVNNFVSSINASSADNLDIIDNDFYSSTGGTTFCARPIIVTDAVGDSRNINIVNNDILGFREYGIRIGTSGTGTMKNIEIIDNNLEDSSSATSSAPIAITSSVPYAINGVKVQGNIQRTKAISVYVQGVQHLSVIGNIIAKDLTGTYPLAQGLYINDCPIKTTIPNTYSTGLAPDQII